MKRAILVWALACLASLVTVGCMQSSGRDGINGSNGKNGKDAKVTIVSVCEPEHGNHSDEHSFKQYYVCVNSAEDVAALCGGYRK